MSDENSIENNIENNEEENVELKPNLPALSDNLYAERSTAECYEGGNGV